MSYQQNKERLLERLNAFRMEGLVDSEDCTLIARQDGHNSALLTAQCTSYLMTEAEFLPWLTNEINDFSRDEPKRSYSFFNQEYVINYRRGYASGLRDCLCIFRPVDRLVYELQVFNNIFNSSTFGPK